MTIDETKVEITTVAQMEIMTLENTDMVRSWATKFANMMVEASDLAKEVHTLRSEMQKITDALAVANEAAARAIEERNEAQRAAERARELQEQAEHAYQNVNEQRIATARELQDTKETLRVNKALLGNVIAREEEQRQEIEEWTKENAALKAEVFHATSGAASMVDAVKAEKEAVISALRLEVQALRDEGYQTREELKVHERDTATLRKIISEAKLANAGVAGVLEGTLAAE